MRFAESSSLATIKLVTTELERRPKTCEGHASPIFSNGSYEFQDASELELAFWNTLDDEEKHDMAEQATKRCFFDALHDLMKDEAKKGAKIKEEDEANASGAKTDEPPPPQGPPVTPPSGSPPIWIIR
jgi:hypothetical protein